MGNLQAHWLEPEKAKVLRQAEGAGLSRPVRPESNLSKMTAWGAWAGAGVRARPGVGVEFGAGLSWRRLQLHTAQNSPLTDLQRTQQGATGCLLHQWAC